MYIIVSTEDNIMHVSLSILANRDGSTSTEKHCLNVSYGSITLISEDVFDISGTIKIPSATAQIHNLPKNAVPHSSGATVHVPDREVEQKTGTIVTGDVEVLLGD